MHNMATGNDLGLGIIYVLLRKLCISGAKGRRELLTPV